MSTHTCPHCGNRHDEDLWFDARYFYCSADCRRRHHEPGVGLSTVTNYQPGDLASRPPHVWEQVAQARGIE